jgi:hypothetical protein
MRRLGGSRRLEAFVGRRMRWRVFIKPPVTFSILMSLALVWAHSWGKKVEISFRAAGAERRRGALLFVLVGDDMMLGDPYGRILFELVYSVTCMMSLRLEFDVVVTLNTSSSQESCRSSTHCQCS